MIPSSTFYHALPKHKAELIDGKMYVAGSLRKSAMVLGYMVENLGTKYVAELCPKDLLQEAVIEVYGRSDKNMEPPLADFEVVEPGYYRPQKLATDVRLSIFNAPGIYVSGGGTAIKLGEDVFTPDVYVIRKEQEKQLTEYYLEGLPDLVIEVVHPYMRDFDYGVRMDRYARAGLAEVWLLDYEKRLFEPFFLFDGKYQLQEKTEEWYTSRNIPEIRVLHNRFFDTAEEFGIQITDIFEVNLPEKERTRISYRKGISYGTIPFSPRLDLDPVPITFSEFISWGGEVKFEMIEGKPVFGGSPQTTQEWLGLLMMTLGLKETVKYLPKEVWSALF